MMNVLERIVADKKLELETRKKQCPLTDFIDEIIVNDRSFLTSLKSKKHQQKPAFILEVKKASPSKGLIRAEFDLNEICNAYKEFATCVSVLTDEKYFQGDFDRIQQVKSMLPQPILCKDFFIDEYQVYLARYKGANAILLMLSVLNDDEYKKLSDVAGRLGLDILTEVSNETEMSRAIELNANIIGINNRNLRDLSTDLNQTNKLVNYFKRNASKTQCNDTILISESGIYHHQQVRLLHKDAHGFLVGSSLMAQPELYHACNELVVGQHKVCGMSDSALCQQAIDQGATFIGLIRVEGSPRFVSFSQAKTLAEKIKTNFVLVTRDMPIAQLVEELKAIGAYAVQLHGAESEQYINTLKQQIEDAELTVEIWKALAVKNRWPNSFPNVDRIILDTQTENGSSGGSGKQFDWEILDDINLTSPKIMLAGGLQAANIPEAVRQNVIGLDINSGVEVSAGKKDGALITKLFQQIKTLTI